MNRVLKKAGLGILISHCALGWAKAPDNMKVQSNDYSEIAVSPNTSNILWNSTSKPTAGTKQFIFGDCTAPYVNHRTCKIANANWYCALAGVGGMGTSEYGNVYFKNGYWYVDSARGGWQGTVKWSCVSL